MKQFISNSPEETRAIGEGLGASLKAGDVVAYYGGLGVGKTAFTGGLAKGLGIHEPITSPTFALVNEYKGKYPLYHFDMYRVETWEDLYSTGFFDYLDTPCVLAIEWSENVDGALPEGTIEVEISLGEREGQRIITIRKRGEKI